MPAPGVRDSQYDPGGDNAAWKASSARSGSSRSTAAAIAPPEKAKADAFDHIKTYGNPVRRHSGPNYRSPWEFEKRMAA